MKKVFILISIILLISYCKKDKSIENSACNNLTTVDSWPTINFKTNYTIQVPNDFQGPGMTGFEGNVFSKFSKDTTLILDYGYCNALFCFDFGDTLQTTVPTSIRVKNISGDLITLNKYQKFCQNSETVGVLYYLDNNGPNTALYWNGRLYWKDNELFRQAMQISFSSSELETLIEIIETIKTKEQPVN
jgi:hypothetical protein